MSTPPKKLTSLNHHLLNAFWGWFEENGFRSHILVKGSAITHPTLKRYINQNQQIVLNIASTATSNLSINSDFITFDASFSGAATTVIIPTNAVIMMYSPDHPDATFAMPAPEDSLPTEIPDTPSVQVDNVAQLKPKNKPFTIVK